MRGTYLILGGVAFVIAVCLFAVHIFVRPEAPGPQAVVAGIPHVYNDPSQSIAHIRVHAFYAVPQNKASSTDPAWHEELQSALAEAARFHTLQFEGRSELSYDIYPQPVFLDHDDAFYDTTSTSDGNPHALINIGQEIDRRGLVASSTPAEYDVMAILYDGVGASGGMIYDSPLATADEIAKKLGVPESVVYVVNIDSVKGFFILNRDYLARDEFKATGDTIFYHEFAHTIGLPDLFSGTDAPSSNDIMGEGRKRPIGDTYLGADLLANMGL